MKHTRITIELALYSLAFLLALGLRFLRLGDAPLSDSEAMWALQALAVAKGDAASLGPQPAYVLLSGLLFFLFGSSNALARFWPALAGSLIVLLPSFFRSSLDRFSWGRKAGLLMAFGMALDPGLVVISRLAGGPVLAMSFGLLALSWAYTRRPLLAGLFAGLALLSGPAALHGALGLALAWGAGKLLERSGIPGAIEISESHATATSSLRTGILTAGGTILLAGTLFLRVPEGLGALAGAIPTYLAGWVSPGGVPASRLLAALVFYEPLPLIFGLAGALHGWSIGSRPARWLSLWALFGLALALLYPGRQVSDLAWALFPLWALAGLELARYFSVEEWELLPALGQATLIVLLLSLAWINLAGLGQAALDLQVYRLRWAVIGGTLVLGLVTSLLIALGWSSRIARVGLAWGLSGGLVLYMLANTWGHTQLRPNSPQELWAPTPVTLQASQLVNTLDDLSEWQTGQHRMLDVLVLSDAPSLQWALRDWERARFSSDLAPAELPAAIIKPGDQPPPGLAEAYRGQDFAWRAFPDWESGLPADWPRWLVFRAAPERKENIILWVRSDLFPDEPSVVVDELLSPGDDPSPGEAEVPAGEDSE